MKIGLPLLLVLVVSYVPLRGAGQTTEKHNETYRRAERVLLESTRLQGIDFIPRGAISHLGKQIVQLDATYLDLPIFYARCAVQVDADGRFERRRVAGVDAAVSENLHPRPPRDTIAEWVLSKGYTVGEIGEFGWLIDDSGVLVPSVRVETDAPSPEARLALYLNAATGTVLESDLLYRTNVTNTVLGSVYLENPVTTPTVVDQPLRYLDPETSYLYGTYARAETCEDEETCETSAPVAVRSEVNGGEFFYDPEFFSDPEAPDPFAEVNAYRNITDVAAWIHEQFGWDGRFADETWLTVRVGQAWDNAAYYAGSKSKPPHIVFGKGDHNYAYDADTAYHEYGHAINDLFWQHSWISVDAYGIDVTMYAMEEAIADIWSATLSDDPTLNAYITSSRNVDNGATCPGSIYGEGHYDSRYISGFLWDVRQTIGSEPFNHILYRSLSFLEKTVNVVDLVEALEQSAADLSTDGVAGVAAWHVDVIQETARSRGLLDEACLNRWVPLDEHQMRYAIGYGRDRTKKLNYPFGLQWIATADGSDRAFHVDLKWLFPEVDEDGEEVVPGYRVHVRKNRPVEVVWRDEDDLEPGDAGFEVVADYTWDGSPVSVEYPILGGVPMNRGDQVFFLISANSDESVIAMQAELKMIPDAITAPPPGLSQSEFRGKQRVSAGDGTSGCGTVSVSKSVKSQIFSFTYNMIFPLFQV